MYYDVYSSCTVLAMSDILKVASSNLVGINYSMNVFLRSWLQLTSVFLHPKCPWISKEWMSKLCFCNAWRISQFLSPSLFFSFGHAVRCQYSSRHYLPATPPPTLDREKLKSLLRRTHLAYINAYIPDGRIRKNNQADKWPEIKGTLQPWKTYLKDIKGTLQPWKVNRLKGHLRDIATLKGK